jgi:hypothetical protein
MHAGFILLIAACLIFALGIGETGGSDNDWWD